jgi:hypothetical protein
MILSRVHARIGTANIPEPHTPIIISGAFTGLSQLLRITFQLLANPNDKVIFLPLVNTHGQQLTFWFELASEDM